MLAETIIAMLSGSTGAMTPVERIQALRRTQSSFTMVRPWVFLAGVIAIVGLVLLLCYVHGRVAARRQARATGDFDENARRHGLTAAEHRLLMTIARLSGISDADLIFSSGDAFCRGAAKLIQERNSAGDSVADRHQLREVIELVHGKIGFASSPEATSKTALGPSSRHIPVGRRISFVTENSGLSSQTAGTVIASDDDGLTVRRDSTGKQAAQAGDRLRIGYDFGTSTWEFESTVTAVTDSEVRLRHCDVARFANRRRFLRVRVHGKAMVARYAFEVADTEIGDALPHFVPADVTEIAGPGLRIETSLDVSVGERLLIVLSAQRGQVLCDIAEVKHVQACSDGFSAALEIATLNDAHVSILVRLTNQAAKRLDPVANTETENVPVPAGRA